jgi:1,4-dihydroxy-2-naphthoate octaprenyltransferase
MAILRKIGLAMELARWNYFPVGVLPIFLGGAVAWHHYHHIIWWKFALCVIGMFFAHLGANAANDYFDQKSGVDLYAYEQIPESRGSGVCGSDILTKGLLTMKEAAAAVAVFFAVAFVCGVILALTSGWLIFFLAVIGFVLGFFYCAPPLTFGYRGYGLGELVIFLAFGPLPVIGTYYVLTGNLSLTAALASLPLAFFTASVVFNQHFAHAPADEAGGKRTPVVIWGEKAMRHVTRLLLYGVYISIIVGVYLNVFPVYALAALATAPLILVSAFRIPIPAAPLVSTRFLFKVVKTNILTSLILIVSFFI